MYDQCMFNNYSLNILKRKTEKPERFSYKIEILLTALTILPVYS